MENEEGEGELERGSKSQELFKQGARHRRKCTRNLKMNIHRIPMQDRTLLTSGTAGEDTVVETGKE
jgi:hypothetical protein